MKQKNMYTCLPTVAAMITSTTIEQFINVIGKPPYYDQDLYKYLLLNGYAIGLSFEVEGKVEGSGTELQLTWKLKNNPAYITVLSERLQDEIHAIYWDGKQIWDPNPLVEDGRPLNDYYIDGIYPVFKIPKPPRSKDRKRINAKIGAYGEVIP